MRTALILGFVLALVPIREDPAPRLEKPPQEQLIGEWRIESGPKDGVLRVRRITATHMLILVDGAPWPTDAFSGPYVVDWTKTPATFDITRNNYKGILKVEGDLLTLCLSLGGNRPTQFDKGQGHLTFSRRMR